MRNVAHRLDRLEQALHVSNAPITDVRMATDAQLEAFLTSLGIDPSNESALVAAAKGGASARSKK